MKDSKYKLNLVNHDVSFTLTYRQAKFKRLERDKGTLNSELWSKTMMLVPQQEKELTAYTLKWKDKATYEKIEKKQRDTIYAQFLGAYMIFYEKKTDGLSYKMNGVHGNNLKDIIAHLVAESDTEQEALEVWEGMLDNWNKLDQFYRDNFTIPLINKHLNQILIIFKRKNGKEAKKDKFDDILNG